MRIRFLALLAVSMVLAFSGEGHAYKVNHYRETPGIRAEAASRKVRLIPIALAQTIAARQVGTSKVSFPEIELRNVSGDSVFMPVYVLKCSDGAGSYEAVVDAVTGRVLDFRTGY